MDRIFNVLFFLSDRTMAVVNNLLAKLFIGEKVKNVSNMQDVVIIQWARFLDSVAFDLEQNTPSP